MMKKEALKTGILNALHGVDPKTATPQQLHQALGETVMEAIAPDWKKSMDAHEHSRRACYFSMEFLVGRAVYNNLLVLDVMQEAEEAFAELGVSLSDLEVIEDAALGNGGLGRLAACFLDSAATLDLPLDGYGIRYKYGLFKQYFEDGCQKEVPDDWMRYGDAWSVRREEDAVLVEFAGQTVRAVPYDMPVIGCKTSTSAICGCGRQSRCTPLTSTCSTSRSIWKLRQKPCMQRTFHGCCTPTMTHGRVRSCV